jgi:hypothetical protein
LVLPDGYGIGPAKVHDVIDLIDEVEIPTLRATGLGDRKVSDLTASELERLIEAAVERALLKATK